MGLFSSLFGGGGSSSSSSSTSTRTDTNISIPIDAGLNSKTIVQNIVGSPGAKLTDYGTTEKAFDLSKLALTEGNEFLSDALDFVDEQSRRNYNFANTVAIPLSQQETENFSKWSLGASAAVAIAIAFMGFKK